jgi:Fic family protein
MAYNWQQINWTNFQYNESLFEKLWIEFITISGESEGFMKSSPQGIKEESIVNLLVNEAIKTSEIEGEFISRIDLISSIRKNLGYPTESIIIKDQRSLGIANLLISSRENFAENLTEEMLFDWNKLLMQGNYSVEVGKWRTHTEPMQVVSGAMGREKVHFEAPPSEIIPKEMRQFFDWFNESKMTIKNPLIRSAVAHLYFESIHPIEDGNGRVGRIIAEKTLSQSLNRPILMSISKTIESNKNAYYSALQKGQSSNEINDWIEYFSQVIIDAQRDFNQTILLSIKKAAFFDANKSLLNERQQKVIKRMLEEGENEFVGGMNARKYLAIAKTSKATSTRDLGDLVEKGILMMQGGGRSIGYQVNL